VFIAACLCVPPIAYGQSPEKPKEAPKQTKKAAGTKDERGSKQSPLIVDVLPPADAQQVARERREHEQAQLRYDGLTGWGTVALAGFTALLWLFTGAMWITTRRMARDAKDTSERNLESLEQIERAYVFVKFEVTPHKNLGDLSPGEVTLIFANRGKTPATLTGFRGAIVASEKPLTSVPTEAKTDFPKAWAVASGRDFEYPMPVPLSIDAEDIRTGKTTIYCCGVVSYQDIFKKPRETGFCWRYIVKGHQFVPDVFELNYQT
jgi:hypothetical protein